MYVDSIPSGKRLSGQRVQRQPHREPRAVPGLALYVHAPAVGLRDPLHDRQSQAAAAVCPVRLNGLGANCTYLELMPARRVGAVESW